jgi:hypothetical protein
MSQVYLLISDPPHGDVDRSIAARWFELPAVEAQMRLNHPAPQVWFAGQDLDDINETARQLQHAGANVRIVEAQRLVGIPHGTPLRRFEFGDTAMTCWGDGHEATIPYDWAAAAISCEPEETGPIKRLTLRQTARAAARNKSYRQEARMKLGRIEEPTDPSFIDLYFWNTAQVERFTVRPAVTEYSGLGAVMKPVARENANMLIEQMGERFHPMHDDRRLHDASGPRVALVGSKALASHLEDADPTLRDIEWYDLLSRLSFLTWE